MRYVTAIAVVLLAVGGLAAIKADQIGQLIAFGEQAQAAGPPPEAVGTSRAETMTLEGTLDAVGSVVSARGVAVSTEVPGVVVAVNFESGQRVRAGEVLVELDTKVERAQLASAQARRDLARANLERTRTLVAKGIVTSQQRDDDVSALKAAKAEVQALQAQIALKSIRAPFDGTLGIREVNLGQYLSPGTSVALLETVESLYVDFTLPQQELTLLRESQPVRVTLNAGKGPTLQGRVAALEPAVNSSTRQLRVRATVDDPQSLLRSGMFVNVAVVRGQAEPEVVVPATAIMRASYGDSVYVVADKPEDEPGMRQTPEGKTVQVAQQVFVKTGTERGDFVAIDEGLQAGQQIVVAGGFKLRNGAPIVVDNSVLPEFKLNPEVTPR